MARSDTAPRHDDAPVRERWEVRRLDDEVEGGAPPAEARETETRVRRTERGAPTDQGRADAAAATRKRRRNWIIAGVILLVLLGLAAWYGWHWYTVGRYLVETDDAYTQTDNVAVSPQVAGYISELLVTDNQQVRKGDVIARIDDRAFRAQVEQGKADVAAATANVHNAEAQIALEQAVIAQAEAGVGSAQAAVTFAQQERDRYSELRKTGAGTVQRLQQAEATLREQQAALTQAQANLEAERKKLAVLETQKEQAAAALQRARAALDQAQINLGYTTLTAPVDGVVGDRSVRLGQYVQPGTRLLTLVPMQDVYVVANYKETQLARMHRGQPVEIAVDAYSGTTVHGRVDSLAPGSGSQFALLPPENATGNFTKIVQRVPVKITLDDGDPLKGRLRPGLSVVPTVDTRDTKGEALDERPPQDGRPPPGRPGP